MTGNRPVVPSVTCPICGLRFPAVVDDYGMTIKYVMEEWQQPARPRPSTVRPYAPAFAEISTPAFRSRFAISRTLKRAASFWTPLCSLVRHFRSYQLHNDVTRADHHLGTRKPEEFLQAQPIHHFA